MGIRFIAADKVTDPESAERILSKYKNREVSMTLDSQSFSGNLVKVDASEGMLRVTFTWKKQGRKLSDIEHVQKFMKSKVGSMIRFRVATDEFVGLLSGVTEYPTGSSTERYVDSPFMLTFAFEEGDQSPKTAGASSGIIGIEVPLNLAKQLRLDDQLEYAPHITVCYFPSLSKETFEQVHALALKAARAIGTFEVRVDGCTTFPTPQEDGTYPHVAVVKSQALMDYHDLVVDLLEHHHPGLVSMDFVHKNYNPHITLKYVEKPTFFSAPKAIAWNVDHLTLNRGTEISEDIPLGEHGGTKATKTALAVEKPYFQFGEFRIPVVVVDERPGEMKIRLTDSSQTQMVDDLEGSQVTFVTDTATAQMEILEVREMGVDGFQVFFRLLVTRIPTLAARRLQYVLAVAKDRGLTDVVTRLGRFLDFESAQDEDEDKEALGPGFEGTDSHIVTYVKAPQTQVIVEGPQFSKGLPLHERI